MPPLTTLPHYMRIAVRKQGKGKGVRLRTGERNSMSLWQQNRPRLRHCVEPNACHIDAFYYDILKDRLGGKY